MTTVGKIAVGVGVAAVVVGGAIWYRKRQSALLQANAMHGAAPVGVTSFYSLAGTAATPAGLTMMGQTMGDLGARPSDVTPLPGSVSGAVAPPSNGMFSAVAASAQRATASFAATAARGHFGGI